MESELQAACPRCGTAAEPGATACGGCGYVRPPFAQSRRPMPALTNQQAIASAVLATIGIVIPFALSIAAVVLALRARATERAHPALGGKTLIQIGFWLGLFGIAGWAYAAIRIAAG